MAFPFVYLAIAGALSQGTGEAFLFDWFMIDVLWEVSAGILIGWIGGKTMGTWLSGCRDRRR